MHEHAVPVVGRWRLLKFLRQASQSHDGRIVTVRDLDGAEVTLLDTLAGAAAEGAAETTAARATWAG